MVIRLLSIQIPQYWEHIKYALSQVERFGSDEIALWTYNRVLASLLNDKSQCFIMTDGANIIKALAITEISEDLITGVRVLYIRCLYAFNPVPTEGWLKDFKVIRAMADEAKCSKITFQTSNSRIESIGKLLGFVQKSINMELEV